MSPKAQRVAVTGAGPAGSHRDRCTRKRASLPTIRVIDRRPIIGGTWYAISHVVITPLTLSRVYTPHLPPGIPSLPLLLSGKADTAVPIPSSFPSETPKTETINSNQLRFSDSAQNEHLHSNITPEIMSFTQEPFPSTLSERILAEYGPGAQFRHREVIREWIEGIFHRGGYDKFVSLSTTVEKAVKHNGEWVLTLRKEGDGRDYWWQERFDALVVATGHYNVPWLPEVEGIVEYDKRWPGKVVHSKHFRKGEAYKGKVCTLGTAKGTQS